MSNTVVFTKQFQESMSPMGASQSLLAMSNEFRSVKRVILKTAFENPDKPRNRILVTSVHGRCGKTFISYNLARSVALEQDKTVLLVDADVTSPSLNEGIRMVDSGSDAPQLGLIDFLMDVSKGLNEVLLNTDVENLKVIPCGNHNYLANELLSGSNMAQLMSEFQTRYPDRVVILDSPPLLDVNETATLSQYVDQVVIVVQDGVTKAHDLVRLSQQIPKDITVHYVLNMGKL